MRLYSFIMLNLLVVIASTRPGRAGLPIGTWFTGQAQADGRFAVQVADLAEVGLPLLDEPKHPMMQQYEHDHTKRWSETVANADAFVFVTPEYNYSAPPSLVNAMDYLYHEWAYKPVGLVSYGGISGGIRSAQMIKLVATTLSMMPIPEAVPIPFFRKHMDEHWRFVAEEVHEKSARDMLDSLAKWATALKSLRG